MNAHVSGQDGGGIGEKYTHFFPGPNWNYIYIIEQSSWITNWRLAEEKSYKKRTYKSSHIETDRKGGDVKRASPTNLFYGDI